MKVFACASLLSQCACAMDIPSRYTPFPAQFAIELVPVFFNPYKNKEPAPKTPKKQAQGPTGVFLGGMGDFECASLLSQSQHYFQGDLY